MNKEPAQEKLSPKISLNKTAVLPAENLAVAVVAGGAGFIGSQLCSTLLLQNCHVFAFDSFLSSKKEELDFLLKNPNFTLVECDLKDKIQLFIPQVDYVFHLAGSQLHSGNPEAQNETLLVNSEGTKNLLELALKYNAKFLLGSTPELYRGYISASSLGEYYGDKKSSVQKLQEAKRFAEGLVQQYYKEKGLNARIVRFTDLYGPGMDLLNEDIISSLFRNYINSKPLSISGDGMQKLHPTFSSDLVYGLIKAMFSQSSNGKVFSLINPEKTTVLNFAYALKKIKDIEIEYLAKKDDHWDLLDEYKISSSQKELGWKCKIDLDEGIKKTVEYFQKKSEQESKSISKTDVLPLEKEKTAVETPLSIMPSKNKKKQKLFDSWKGFFSKIKVKHKRIKKENKKEGDELVVVVRRGKIAKLLGFVLFAVFLAALPFVICIAELFLVKSQLSTLEGNIRNNQMQSLQQNAESSIKRIQFSQTSWRFFRPYFTLFGLSSGTDQVYNLFTIALHSSELAMKLSEGSGNLGKMLDIVIRGKSGDIEEQYKKLQSYIAQVYNQSSFIQTELLEAKDSTVAQKLGLSSTLNDYYEKLPPLREKLFYVQELSPALPELLGFKSKKTYLVLLQNNMELRATGGFIGSYALLTFDKGKLLDWQVFDVYDADGQLRGHVEPPESLKKYLGEANWYLRDSNWDPDFTLSAARAEWFLDKELGRQVDGVIGVNSATIQNCLAALGQVAVPDYDEMINDKNLFERAEYYAEVNFFPGSTQKKDFLGALSSAMFDQTKNLDEEKWLLMSEKLFGSFAEKSLFLYIHDPKSAAIFHRFGWDGSLVEPPRYFINSNEALDSSDFIMAVDSNVGINKVNYFLKREISWKGTILKDGRMQKELQITYQNDSQSDSWPGGRYKNYFRLLVPEGNVLSSISAGDKPDNMQPVEKENISSQLDNGKQVFGVYFIVPTGEKRILKINYEKKEFNDFSRPDYKIAFYFQKQSGTASDKLDFELNYPLFLKPIQIYPEGKIENQKTVFNTEMSKDRQFYLELVK